MDQDTSTTTIYLNPSLMEFLWPFASMEKREALIRWVDGMLKNEASLSELSLLTGQPMEKLRGQFETVRCLKMDNPIWSLPSSDRTVVVQRT